VEGRQGARALLRADPGMRPVALTTSLGPPQSILSAVTSPPSAAASRARSDARDDPGHLSQREQRHGGGRRARARTG
jgi:hypothetical protein